MGLEAAYDKLFIMSIFIAEYFQTKLEQISQEFVNENFHSYLENVMKTRIRRFREIQGLLVNRDHTSLSR